MLPQRKNDSVGGRYGFEVHVIGSGRPAVASGGGDGLEIGLRIGSGRSDGAGGDGMERPPVHRLEGGEGAEPLRVRPTSAVGPAEPGLPGRRRARRGLAHWTVWMAAGTCTLAVAAVAGVMAARGSRPAETAGGAEFVFEKADAIDKERAYFLAHPGELAAEAESLLARYAAAATVSETLDLVREPERVRTRMEEHWRPWGAVPAFDKRTPIESFFVEDGGRAAIGLRGGKGDFSRFELVFVREGTQLKLDWEASCGIGEARIEDLRTGGEAKERMVRAVVRPGRFHTKEFPEDRYGSYQLLDLTGEHFVWAFALRESAEAAALEEEFNESSILLDKAEAVQATLRVSGPLREGGSLFVITELLHKGWVTP